MAGDSSSSPPVVLGRGAGRRNHHWNFDSWGDALSQVLRDGGGTDFTFIVGPERQEIGAISTLLALRSQVLERLIDEEGKVSLDLDSVSPNVFRHFLQYIYSDNLGIIGIKKESSASSSSSNPQMPPPPPPPQRRHHRRNPFPEGKWLSLEEMFSLLQLAQTYKPGRLLQDCVDLVMKHVKESHNPCKVYEMAKAYQVEMVKTQIFNYIVTNTLEIIETDDFNCLSTESMTEVMKCDSLSLSETCLFQAFLRWRRNQNDGVGVNAVLEQIRFPLMTGKEFTSIVSPEKVLPTEDLIALLEYFCSNGETETRFSKMPRNHSKQDVPRDVVDTGTQTEDNQEVNGNCQPRPTTELPTLNILTPPTSDVSRRAMETGESELVSNIVTTTTSAPPVPLAHSSTPMETDDADTPSNEDNDDDTESDSDDQVIVISLEKETFSCWDEVPKKFQRHSERKGMQAVKLDKYEIKHQYRRVDMPKIDAFMVDLKIPMNKADRPTPEVRFLRTFDIRKYLFFATEWKLDMLWVKKVAIELKINGVKFLKMDRANNKELTVSFRNDSVEIMGALIDQRNLEKVNLVLTDLPHYFPCGSLKEVVLYKIRDYFKTELFMFLQKCTKLETLACYPYRQRFDTSTARGLQDKSPVNLSKDLLCPKLHRLSLGNMKILYTSGKVKINNLTELYTTKCHWTPEIYAQFHIFFPNLKRFSVRKCPITSFDFYESDMGQVKPFDKKLVSTVSVKLMRNILKIDSIEWIHICGMDWENGGAQDQQGKVTTRLSTSPSAADEFFVKGWFRRVNLETPENFLLEKKHTGCWGGKKLNTEGVDWTSLDFDNFELNKIYEDVETFETYSPDACIADLID